MQTLRVSATDIDAYRYFRDNEDAELNDLLAQLRRETPPTDAMMAGTALHSALEIMPPEANFEYVTAGEYTFTFSADAEVDMPVIREMKATHDYEVDGCLVTLVGKVDALHGRRIDDHKFTSRFDPERFLNSLQWRVYLDIFGADEFRWNVFEGRQDRGDPKHYVITAIHPMTMHRYPGMEGDIARALDEFVSFARRFMPERIGQEAA